jgi:hypothetical protein
VHAPVFEFEVQVAPSAFAGFEHSPVPESQDPAVWQLSDAPQVTFAVGTHAPA